MKIESLVNWSDPKRVETKHGPRNLRTGRPSNTFWSAWRSDKQTLKDAGVSVGKDRSGTWEALWWLPISEEEQKASEEAQQASRAVDADIDIPSPDGLEYLPFQKAGIKYALDRQNVLVADSMGLGKTLEAIGVFNSDPAIKRVLIICPASLRLNWKREFEKWSTRPVRIEIVNGGKPKDWPDDNPDVVIINYDVLQKHRKRIDMVAWDMLVGDEIHLCKSQKAQRTKAVFGWKTKEGEIKQRPIAARRKLYLTGTPIVNRSIELWLLVESLDPKDLGRNFFRFAKRYTQASCNGYGWDFSGADKLDELQRKMREKFMVRRLKKDVLKELPPKRRQILEIPANGAEGAITEEKRMYAKHQEWIDDLERRLTEAKRAEDRDLISEITGQLKHARGVAFTEMARVRHEVALAKVPAVCEHLENALEGGPIVCFAHHRDVIAQIAERFGDRAVVLTGDTKMEDRQKAVDRFQAGEVDLFVGNIQAAGVGITLTKSSHVVFAELDWVPGNLTQAEDRTHRIGQAESVLIQHIVLEESLDATMAEKLIEKQDVIDRTLDRKEEKVQANGNPDTEVEVKSKPEDEAATNLTLDQIAAAREGLRRLAGMCDGAVKLDGCGFNKHDSKLGKSLARSPEYTSRQALTAIRLVNKYRRQLPDELVVRATGNEVIRGE